MMKFAVFFLLCCVALAAAAPQYLTTWPGFVGAYNTYPRTLLTGPTLYNGGLGAYGGRLLAPGYLGLGPFY